MSSESRARIAVSSSWLLATAFTACAGFSIPPPPVVETTPVGTVRAHSPQVARTVAAWLDEFVPRIRAELPALRDVAPDVWVQRDLRVDDEHVPPDWVDGFTITAVDRIHVREGADELSVVVCHELVHLLLDDSWSPLPTVIEEGLCERLAIRIAAAGRIDYAASKRLVAAVYLGAGGLTLNRRFTFPDGSGVESDVMLLLQLQMQPRSAAPMESLQLTGGFDEVRGLRLGAEHYGFGTWLVDRIVDRVGYDGLHALCLDAAEQGRELLSVEQILAAAGLPDEPARWRRTLVESFDEADLLALASRFREAVLASATRFLLGRFGGRFLAEYPRAGLKLVLGFPRGPRVEIQDLEWLRDGLATGLPAAEQLTR